MPRHNYDPRRGNAQRAARGARAHRNTFTPALRARYPKMSLETVSTPIVGFRAWVIDLDEPSLRSVAMRHVWPTDGALAQCMAAGPDQEPRHPGAPYEDCRCGIHARTTIEGVKEEYPYYPTHGYWGYSGPSSRGYMCMGACIMWGTVLRGAKVIRSEYAKPVCLTDPGVVWIERSGMLNPANTKPEIRERRAEAIDMVCREYGLPFVPYESCTAYAAEFGELT